MEEPDSWEPSELDTVNMGIAVVTPVQEMIKVIESEEVQAEMKKADEEYAKRIEPTEDVAEDESEFERFERLTQHLVNTPKPETNGESGAT